MNEISTLASIHRLRTDTSLVRRPKPKADRIPVVCMECGKKFSVKEYADECPKCGGTDIEVR